MWNEPTKEDLAKLPRLYATDGVKTEDQIVKMHFFIGACDWYVVEFDGEDLFFCYAILNGDLQNAEWGYTSLDALKSVRVDGIEIDRDLYWQERPFKEIRL